MTFDLPTVITLITAALFTGGQIATLASVVRSNRDQGRRIGALERWQEKVKGREEAIKEREVRDFSQGIVQQPR